MTSYFDYWGKTESESSSACHLAIWHCLDVAAVGSVFLEEDASFLRRLSETSGLKSQDAKRLVLFFLALHDIGKLSDDFQSRRADIMLRLQDRAPAVVGYARHGEIGFAMWEHIIFPHVLQQAGDGTDQDDLWDVLNPWAEAAMGHHGRPVDHVDAANCPISCSGKCDVSHIRSMVSDLCDMFEITPSLLQKLTYDLKPGMLRTSWSVAGLAVLADWIASGRTACCQKIMPLYDYWMDRALPMARSAVRECGILVPEPASDSRRLFSFSSLSPMQEFVLSCDIDRKPQLFILEDSTGSGKTEAALFLAHRMMRAGSAQGIYWALPTMATANAMHERMLQAYSRLYEPGAKPSLVLAHGSRHMVSGFRNSIGFKNGSRSGCDAWIADNRKKTFLAAVGVGTIDQALLTILPSRHQSLRMAGLGRSVLVVDEVHACDPYMHALLRRLLEFHAAQGGSAILLSATLPKQTRQELVDSFRGGGAELTSDCFPMVTHAASTMVGETPIASSGDAKRDIWIKMTCDASDAEKMVTAALESNQCVAWIRNTVGDAIEAHDRFARRMPADRLMLFHSRFALCDRLEIEQKVIQRFGKNSRAADRRGRLIIATQVIEQSLDLDFDMIVTDLAPMDLLIQRMGRLHRHKRDRQGNPARIEERSAPICVVVSPEPVDNAETSWFFKSFRRAAFVYKRHGMLWLTAKALSGCSKLSMPDDARYMINAVFDPDAQERVPVRLARRDLQAEGDEAAQRSMGNLNSLKLLEGYRVTPGQWLSDTVIPTRLGQISTTLRLACWDGTSMKPWAPPGWFAWEFSQLSCPGEITEDSGLPRQQLENTKDKMHDKGRWSILLPIQQGSDGSWTGLCEKNGKPSIAVYDAQQGLRIRRDK